MTTCTPEEFLRLRGLTGAYGLIIDGLSSRPSLNMIAWAKQTIYRLSFCNKDWPIPSRLQLSFERFPKCVSIRVLLVSNWVAEIIYFPNLGTTVALFSRYWGRVDISSLGRRERLPSGCPPNPDEASSLYFIELISPIADLHLITSRQHEYAFQHEDLVRLHGHISNDESIAMFSVLGPEDAGELYDDDDDDW